MKTIRRPISILLAVLMVVGMFTMVPISAGAAGGDYYLVGTMNDWNTADTTYQLDRNPENTDEYMLLDFAADANTEFKVVSAGNYIAPTNNFTLNAAGTYDIYFRPDGSGNQADGWVDGKVYANNFRAPATYVAQIGDTKYETLAAAIEAAAAYKTIDIIADCTLDEEVTINKNVTINFNDKIVTVTKSRAIVVDTGKTVTFKGTTGGLVGSGDVGLALVKGTLNINGGKYDALEMTNDGLSAFKVEPGAWLNMQGGEINAKYYGIYTHGENSRVWIQNTAKVHSVDASAISGNGLAANKGYYIYINGGTITSDNDSAIYHPNEGTLQISPYNVPIVISGATGIYTKAGTTKITANKVSPDLLKIIGTGAAANYAYNGNGTNPTGDAFVIDNCNYPNGGPIVDIKFGTFESANGKAVASYVGQDDPNYKGADQERVENFISVGYEGYEPIFSSPVPEAYCAEGYKPVDNGGTYTVGSKTYVAQIGDAKYETLEAAFAAAVDGDTITVLADSTGNGIKAPQGKFATGLTVDFNGHKYTVDGTTVGSTGTETQAFQLLKGNTITFKNGTLTSDKAQMIIQNYSNLTLDNMTIDGTQMAGDGNYALSNNNGNVVIKDTTISAREGCIAFDVCRYASYPSVKVTVTGDSVINGDVEIYASKGQAKEGFSLTLESGTLNGDIVVDPTAQSLIGEDNTITKADTFTQEAPADFEWVDNGDGTSSLAAIEYVAKIGDTKYRTLEAAFAAAVDGDTITVLADCSGNGIKVTPAGKFATGLTVDFDGHTYTVDGETVGSLGTETLAFQLLKNNKVTFKNGTIYSEKAKMLVQNYCDLTLDGMTLTLNNTSYNGAYTLSNNNGNTVIKDTTINANPTTGSFAFDVCRYSSYPSVNVTVTGNSAINGDVEIFASKGQAKDGFSLNLNGGTMSGEIIVTPSAAAAMESAPEKVSVNKAADFDQEAPEGYMWVDTETEGVQTIAKAVAQIGETKYATLEAAFAAAVDGDTIKVLADSAGNGIKVLKNKFKTNGLTVDFDGHTYTMDGETVGSPGTETLAFQLQYNNKITFKNGTLYSEKALFLVQNYSNLTLDGMTLTLNNPNYAYGYTLSNNYGNTVIKDTTINANPAGKFAFDVCRGGGSDAYKYVHVTVTGNSVINGNVEVDARNGDPKTGFSLNLESGTMNGDIKLTANAETAIDNNPDRASVNKQNTFNQDPAAGYKWKDNGDGTSTLVKADLFAGYGLTLHGDIGLIFYLDPAAVGVDAANVSSVSVSFTCDKYTGTVTDFTREGDYIKVAYYVPAAYMASPVHAYSVTINGVTSNEINDYTVQEYALRVIADPSLISDDETTQNNAVKLMKEMLNYGAKAKAVFQTQMSAPDAAVYETIPEYTMATVTPDMIDAAIKGEATDMSTVHPEADANFYAPSVIYLSKTTLRMVFLIPTGNGSTCPEEYSGSQAPWYYWKDVTDIPAAELDEQQQFEINGVTFHYSVLDYAKAVVAGGSSAQKDLAASLYLYNQAANAFFAD